LGCQAFQAQAQAAVGRHAVAEYLQVALEGTGIHAPGFHLFYIVVVDMHPFPAGSYLDAAEEEIEAQGFAGTGGIVQGVERPLGAWVMGDKDEIAAPVFLRVFADEPFFFRVQIVLPAEILSGFLEHRFVDLPEFYRDDLFDEGNFRDAQRRDFGPAIFPYLREDVVKGCGLRPDDFLESVFKDHLEIQGNVLVQVAACVVFLRPEYRRLFVDPAEYADHHLFVELGRLGKIGVPVKVIQPEQIRPPLGSGADDLRGADPGKPDAVQKAAKFVADTAGDAEYGPLGGMPQGQGPVVEFGAEIAVQRLLRYIHRQFLRRGGREKLHRRNLNLHIPWMEVRIFYRSGGNPAPYPHRRFRPEPLKGAAALFPVNDALDHIVGQPQMNKAPPGQFLYVLYLPREGNFPVQ
jgi:hypothetical protein